MTVSTIVLAVVIGIIGLAIQSAVLSAGRGAGRAWALVSFAGALTALHFIGATSLASLSFATSPWIVTGLVVCTLMMLVAVFCDDDGAEAVIGGIAFVAACAVCIFALPAAAPILPIGEESKIVATTTVSTWIASHFSYIFWPVILLSFVGFFCWMHGAKPWRVLSLALVIVVLLDAKGTIDTGSVLNNHPILVPLILLAYIPLGIAWLLLNWRFKTARWADAAMDKKREWLRFAAQEAKIAVEGATVPEALIPQWKKYAADCYDCVRDRGRDKIFDIPRWRDHRDRLYTWGISWPVSIIWSVAEEILPELWDILVARMTRLLDWVSKAAMSNARLGLDDDPAPPSATA